MVLSHLNMIFGCKKASETFWRSEMKHRLMAKFERSLDDKETATSFDLRKNINIRDTLSRLIQMTGINLSSRAREEFEMHPTEFEFVSPDLEALSVKVKHMNIIDLNAAIVCRLEAVNKYGTEYDRLFALAVSLSLSSLFL